MVLLLLNVMSLDMGYNKVILHSGCEFKEVSGGGDWLRRDFLPSVSPSLDSKSERCKKVLRYLESVYFMLLK
jgi:hypothetical protein